MSVPTPPDAPSISRRRLASGIAWSVPVVVSAVAAPAYAASGCPELTVAGYLTTSSYDRVTVTNSGTVTWPIGTTITWTIQNRSSNSDTFWILSRTGVSQSGASSITVAPGATGTLTFTTTAAVAPGAFVRWVMTSTDYTYYSTITLSYPVMPTSCSPRACFSGTWNGGYGATCVGGGTAAAARSASTTDASWRTTRGPRA